MRPLTINGEEVKYRSLKQGISQNKLTTNHLHDIVNAIFQSRARLFDFFSKNDIKKTLYLNMLPQCIFKCRKPKLQESKLSQIIKNGEKRFYHELDLINLLKSVRLSKILFNSQLNQR